MAETLDLGSGTTVASLEQRPDTKANESGNSASCKMIKEKTENSLDELVCSVEVGKLKKQVSDFVDGTLKFLPGKKDLKDMANSFIDEAYKKSGDMDSFRSYANWLTAKVNSIKEQPDLLTSRIVTIVRESSSIPEAGAKLKSLAHDLFSYESWASANSPAKDVIGDFFKEVFMSKK